MYFNDFEFGGYDKVMGELFFDTFYFLQGYGYAMTAFFSGRLVFL